MDTLTGVVVDLFPMGNPSRGAPYGEQHREHVERNPDGPKNDSRIEIDVWIETALCEVVICQSRFLHLSSDIEQRIIYVHRFQEVVSCFLENLRTRIKVAIDAVAETHKTDP